MEYVSVQQLKEVDLGFAFDLNVAEEWNDRFEDIKRMLGFEPDGCFIAEVERERAGHVFSISYGKLGWIGLLVVKAEYRKMGIGKLLTTKAKDYLLSRGVQTVKLEAVPEVSGLYRKMGFVDEYDSLRFKGTVESASLSRSSSSALIKKKDLAELASFDSRYFGADRTRVLRKLYDENPQLCFFSYSGSEITGYVMCRKAKIGYNLGPMVCNPGSPETAKELLQECMGKLSPKTEIFVGVPAINLAATKILRELGFVKYSHSIRMRFGKKLENECVKGIFAIGGPMKG